MQNIWNYRSSANCVFFAGMLLLAVAACNKQVSAPAARAPKTSTGLTVGTPPGFIAWLRGPDVPAAADLGSGFLGRISPFSFSIGGKGYMGAGLEVTTTEVAGKDMWQYDTITRAWTQVANWPGAAHTSMASFVIGNSGYVCTGASFPDNSNPNLRVREVWQYDQTANKWMRKSNFPGGARSGAVAAAINGKGYLGTGTTAGSDGNRDWWQYDPATDGWVQKANLPGPKRTEAVAFAPPVANGKVYVSTGYDAPTPTAYYNDLWAYNPSTDNWAQRASLPAQARGEAVGISLPNTGVVSTGLGGQCETCALNDCWQFSPATGNWFQLPNVGGGQRLDAGSFGLGNTIYIGAGRSPAGGFPGQPKTDFWGLDLN